jgi:hypothetical protein
VYIPEICCGKLYLKNMQFLLRILLEKDYNTAPA